MEIILIIALVTLVIVAWITVGLVVNFFGWIVTGLVIGALARLFLHGTRGMGILRTLLAGIVGALGGGIVADQMNTGGAIEFALAVIVAVFAVAVLKPKDTVS